MKFIKNVFTVSKVLIIVLSLSVGVSYVFADWAPPLTSPPSCPVGDPGCDAPVNVGTVAQIKDGDLTVDAFAALLNSYFAQKLGIGIVPSASSPALEVAGQVKITGGSPGSGKVLTSDSTGLASWEAPTTGGGTGGGINGVNGIAGVNASTVNNIVTLSTDTNYVQRRISNTCQSGYFIRNISALGVADCQPDQSNGGGGGSGNGVSQIIAGTNINISPSNGTGAVTINSTSSQGPAGPTGPQGPQGPAGSVSGGNNLGTGTGDVFKNLVGGILNFRKIKAGTGISVTTTGDDVVITNTVGGGGTGGGITNINTTNNTGITITNPAGPTVTINADTSYLQRKLGPNCTALGYVMKGLQADGFTPDCVLVGDITSVNAGTGLTGGNASGDATLNVDYNFVQKKVGNQCSSAGQYIKTIGIDGVAVCGTDQVGGGAGGGTGDITAVNVMPGLTGGGTAGDVTIGIDPSRLQLRLTRDCLSGQYLRTIDIGGNPICINESTGGNGDITAVNTVVNSGITGGASSGDVSLNIDYNIIQKRIGGGNPCNPGYSIREISSSGVATCAHNLAAPTLRTCGPSQFVTGIDTSGNLMCGTLSSSQMCTAVGGTWNGTKCGFKPAVSIYRLNLQGAVSSPVPNTWDVCSISGLIPAGTNGAYPILSKNAVDKWTLTGDVDEGASVDVVCSDY